MSTSGGGVIFWDFDGTLAERPGLWSMSLIEVLDHHEPGHRFVRDDVRPLVRQRFPWNRHDQPHGHVGDPAAWWAEVNELFLATYMLLGYGAQRSSELALEVRKSFLRPSAWRLFDDTIETLGRARQLGWKNVIVSNHVPELEDLVGVVGLGGLIDLTVTSGLVGFDKPHASIFEHALRLSGRPDTVWMVGDNPVADVEGAEALGIPAVLVRAKSSGPRAVSGLGAALDLVLASPSNTTS